MSLTGVFNFYTTVIKSLILIPTTTVMIWAGGDGFDVKEFDRAVGDVLTSLCFVDFDRDGYRKLLIETAAYESDGGAVIKQVGGPALGVYQIEPSTHDYIVRKWLHTEESKEVFQKSNLRNVVDGWYVQAPPGTNRYNLKKNIHYQTTIAFLVYYHRVGGWPDLSTVESRAKIYKTYYNTPKGKGKKKKYIEAAKNFWEVNGEDV